MKTGNIKTNTSLWVGSRKIKDLLNVSLWNNLENILLFRGRPSYLKLFPRQRQVRPQHHFTTQGLLPHLGGETGATGP